MTLRSFKYRFYPTKKQAMLLVHWFALCQVLYNAALQERKAAWRWRRSGWEAPKVTYEQQTKSLTQIRSEDPEFRSMPVEVARSALDRVNSAEQRMIADRKDRP